MSEKNSAARNYAQFLCFTNDVRSNSRDEESSKCEAKRMSGERRAMSVELRDFLHPSFSFFLLLNNLRWTEHYLIYSWNKKIRSFFFLSSFEQIIFRTIFVERNIIWSILGTRTSDPSSSSWNLNSLVRNSLPKSFDQYIQNFIWSFKDWDNTAKDKLPSQTLSNVQFELFRLFQSKT